MIGDSVHIDAQSMPRDGAAGRSNVSRAEMPHLLHRLIAAQIAATPDAIAVVSMDRTLTYGELGHAARRLADHLAARDVRPDELVAVSMERSPELLITLLAVLTSGAAFLPIDPELPRDRTRYKLETAGVSRLLSDDALIDRVRDVSSGLPLTVLDVGSLLAIEPGTVAGAPAPTEPHHLAYALFTSGSTGRPKGVLIPHRAISAHARWFTRRIDLSPTDRVLQLASIGFDAAMAELFAPLTVGATVVMAPPMAHRDLRALPTLIEAERITVVQLVPSALRVVADSPHFAATTSLRYLICGGEALDATLVAQVRRQLPALRIGNFYGPTETTIDATSHEIIETPSPGDVVPIGVAVTHGVVRVLDDERRPVPVGTPGELYIGGVGLARGYLARPDLTADRFVRDPLDETALLYRSGDLVRERPDGALEYIGRIDAQVKLRGYRIELGEIEAVLLAQPGVREAAVVVHDDGEPQLAAYVVPSQASDVNTRAIRDALREQLPSYMVPASISRLSALPLTVNGKLDRRALPAPQRDVDDGPDRGLLLSDPTERALLRIWSRALGTRSIGPDDDFFALGGHSVLAIRLLGDIETEFGVALRASTLFQAPTVRTLAALLRSPAAPDESTMIPVRREGSATPLFVAPGGGGEMLVFDALSRALGEDQPLYVLDIYAFTEAPPDQPALTLPDVARRMLTDLRAIQPRGPYRLAGYSLGGNIVYEMAQQLRESGEVVELLALLDADGPDYPILQPFVVRTVKHLQHAASLGVGGMGRYVMARVAALSRRMRREDAHDTTLYANEAEAEDLPAHVVEATERALTPVLRAWERYRPQPYDGDVVLVRARIRQQMVGVLDDDPMLGWSPLLRGRVMHEEIDCDHFSLLKPAFARPLAALLARHLASTRGPAA
jgi:amino acid adenylation domain-containing protein